MWNTPVGFFFQKNNNVEAELETNSGYMWRVYTFRQVTLWSQRVIATELDLDCRVLSRRCMRQDSDLRKDEKVIAARKQHARLSQQTTPVKISTNCENHTLSDKLISICNEMNIHFCCWCHVCGTWWCLLIAVSHNNSSWPASQWPQASEDHSSELQQNKKQDTYRGNQKLRLVLQKIAAYILQMI